MGNFRERIARFMQGRYGGNDTLNHWLIGAFFVIVLISVIFQIQWLNYLSLAVLVYEYFRIFSRNIPKRMEENRKFVSVLQKIKRWFAGILPGKSRDKTHKIFACPDCKQKVRVPKGRGKIEITCPKCNRQFRKRS